MHITFGKMSVKFVAHQHSNCANYGSELFICMGETELKIVVNYLTRRGPGSSVGITVRDRILVGMRFSAHPDRPWSPPSLL